VNISYLFASREGSIPVDEATLRRPFIVRPYANHPFMTLEDYFAAIRDLIFREDGRPLLELLGRLWRADTTGADLDMVAIRYEKWGTLYHIASVEVVAGPRKRRLAVSTAVTDASKESLDREFNLLRRLHRQTGLSFLPEVYCKHAVGIRKAEGSETLLMTLSEWFENYHEWHFSKDDEGNQRIVLWDMENGYRLLSQQETYEVIRQAVAILTSYYDTETHCRIVPWHHGGGDFVVRTAGGAVDVKLVTARGHEPVPSVERAPVDTSRAIILFFLETTLKMRLDKYEGMGESTWARTSVVAAVVDGFFASLRLKESSGLNAGSVMKQLASFTEAELRRLLSSRMEDFRAYDPSDLSIMMSHLDEHARDLHHAIQRQARKETG